MAANIFDQKASSTIRQLVSFVVGDEEYGTDILRVQEIIKIVDITRVPNAPEIVEGVINLRGKIVPVVELRKRFHLSPKEKDKDTRIIVVDLQEKVIGFLVDQVKEVIRVENSIIDPPPKLASTASSQFITGVVKLEGRLLILLDLDQVLSVEEQQAITTEEPVQ